MHVIMRTAKYRHYARIQDVPPSRGELFYLRALLQHRPASSFVDVRTIDGIEYNTFQEAAIRLGLFADDHEAEYALTEAIQTLKTPHQLRVLFVHLLVNECILTPIEFWNTFQYHLCLDFTLRCPDVPNVGVDHGLQHIGQLLEEYGKHPSDYHLPEPTTYGREVHELQRWAPFAVQLAARSQAAYDMFNNEQREIFDDILSAIIQRRPLQMFIDGKAGVGKTFMINALIDKVRSLNIISLPTATSAFAAQLYPGGRTTHSTFKVSSTFTDVR
jgi:hypothetical protein